MHLGVSEDGTEVAIKTVTGAAAEHGSRFRREAAGLRRVNSENVAKLVDYVENEEFGRVLIMEFIPGELLSDALQVSMFSVPECVELGLGLARGLADMHRQGVVHRDLKPSNVMLRPTPDGGHMPVIFDLGLARLLEVRGSIPDVKLEMTSTGGLVAIGTPAYMAPEQILDAARSMPSADVYGVGVTLYRAASGVLPFPGDDRDIARRKLTEGPPRLFLTRQDELGLRYAELVHRCLARRPSERYEDGAALVEALTELSTLVEGMPRGARITSGTLSRVELPRRQAALVPPSSGTTAPGASLAFRSPAAAPRPAVVVPNVSKPAPPPGLSGAARVAIALAILAVMTLGVWLGLK